MSIGNQEFGKQENTNTKSVFGIYVSNFLFFCWYFIRNLEYDLVKSWFSIGICRQNKNRFGILVSVVAISLVSVWFLVVIFLKVAPLVLTNSLKRWRAVQMPNF